MKTFDEIQSYEDIELSDGTYRAYFIGKDSIESEQETCSPAIEAARACVRYPFGSDPQPHDPARVEGPELSRRQAVTYRSDGKSFL